MVIAELGHLSLMNNLEKLSSGHDNVETQPQHHNPSSGGGLWVWNPGHHQHEEATQPQGDEDDESWEVRAFAEDTGSVMGTTWPPRSYTCTFCKREFRSAQALGGHMNVHRRDRARLHQGTSPSSSSSALYIPAQELLAARAAGGLCLLYQLPPNHNGGVYTTTNTNACNNFSSAGVNHQHRRAPYNKSGESNSSSFHYSNKGSSSSSPANKTEELDLELRL